MRAPEQAHQLDEYRHDDEAYDADNPPYASHEDYQTEVPSVRRRGLALMIAMTGLALLGTAGAVGYREMFGGSVIATPPPTITASSEPNKIAPVSGEPKPKTAATLAKTVQIPPARSKNSSRRKSNQRRLSRRKARRLAWARRARLRRPLPVSRYRTKSGRTLWRPRILQGLVPMRLRRSVLANRLQRTAQLNRTARIWLPPPSHLPKRTARRR